MAYFWGLRHRIPHKMIACLFMRIAIMIAVLIKCTIYEDCDHDRNPHKTIMFFSLYMIVIMIAVLFIRTAIMIAIFTKCHIFEFLWGLRPIMARILTKCPIFEVLIAILTKYHISQSVLTELTASTNKKRSAKRWTLKKNFSDSAPDPRRVASCPLPPGDLTAQVDQRITLCRGQGWGVNNVRCNGEW